VAWPQAILNAMVNAKVAGRRKFTQRFIRLLNFT
jgi:hypothetical protein